ncbi:uncharacterized protein C8R40DRAFT_1109301 [Lentinula edodes]|uniref:uncharacterized protein n=1 Tax=Lentinula edodes TaxID=5353 RepID=UPI001E8EDC45|nr:uncharacterized protein C8R40DRAFT_1137268 [Lentinula edodes]XP_046081131.1 uncharacterized protein C8R40DRAFT_1127757 [Lentinula edodes]XP_046081132.1 uncharacterized protein C8R40DRAFT_1127761 [Lentinula edodes]XP_046081457.1 uncharacterized protein C8R40DRAFT_1127170 [Lentinula edodes]XP_046085216.1 uncharacterized protein C8R40DRAFT_1109301 [Lentinula edodes]KAH7867754.1 hypothetical protein C8R40DRAFT_1137268 [Lentinula edodes]KAH7870037.1 hypothetical protein C8R40DRAFT_1127757 [Lent
MIMLVVFIWQHYARIHLLSVYAGISLALWMVMAFYAKTVDRMHSCVATVEPSQDHSTLLHLIFLQQICFRCVEIMLINNLTWQLLLKQLSITATCVLQALILSLLHSKRVSISLMVIAPTVEQLRV